MKTVGLAATAAAGTAIVGSPGSATSVVDLGDKGLSNGDSVDRYLEQHFTDGNEVRVPPGEYEYTGAGLGGDKSDCALVGAPEGVVFERPGPDAAVRPTLWAASGTVRVENVTVRGKCGEGRSRWRVGAAEGATVDLVNVNMPDGAVEGSDSTGIYAGTDHAGALRARHCFFSRFGDVACHVSDPYVRGNGGVVVEDCAFVNTGTSALRLAPDDSAVRRCYFEATEEAPASHAGRRQRGIRIDDAGSNLVVEDCDFDWGTPGGPVVEFDDRGAGGDGVVRNLRVANDGDDPTFVQEWDVAGNWTGENLHLTGSGDHDAPDGFETVTGARAERPDAEYAVWTPPTDGRAPGGSASVTANDSGTNATATVARS